MSQAGAAVETFMCRNSNNVQDEGHFALFETLLADVLVDHTPNKVSVSEKLACDNSIKLCAFRSSGLHPEINWQVASAVL
jgi:hypothetical protein